MKIAFFGLPLAALLLASDGHDIVFAGICREGALGTRRLRRLLRERVVMRPDVSSVATRARVVDAKPDLIVSWFWVTQIPKSLLEVAPRGALGVHPSLLPRHRGPDPYFAAIDAGDVETGVSAHLLDEQYDTGAVLGRRAIRIEPEWNAWKLAKALDRPSLALLRDVVRAYAAGTPPIPEPQDDARATAAPLPTDDDLEIRWSDPAARIARRVRAAAPWPGAFTDIGGQLVVLTHVRATRDYPRALAPGEAAVRADGVAVVRAADDALELHAGRSEGDDDDDDERTLSAADLAAIVRAARAPQSSPA
jgi:methionyl-tRNA formyltransferase